MSFADLSLLWGLLPVFTLWAGLVVVMIVMGGLGRWLRPSSLRFSSTARLKQLRTSPANVLRKLTQLSRLLVVALLIVAMTRPQTGKKHSKVVTEGIDIFVVIDTSGSMQALDLDTEKPIKRRRNRLEVVKDVVAEFIARRDNDQLGLIVFGTEAYTQCPLTLDHGIVDTFLKRVELGVAGEATALGSGLGTAVKRLKDSDATSKVIILLTDGSSNAGNISPRKAAEIAKTYGIKVYTIGAGSKGKAPVLVDGFFGKQVQYIDADLDQKTLHDIATLTGGKMFRAEDAKALGAIYDEINALEKTEIETLSYMEYNEQFHWFVLPAILLLLLEMLLLGTRLRKIP